jgi:hypothetical protein
MSDMVRLPEQAVNLRSTYVLKGGLYESIECLLTSFRDVDARLYDRTRYRSVLAAPAVIRLLTSIIRRCLENPRLSCRGGSHIRPTSVPMR